MVVLPYKDRLLLFSRYLQQLVMESLGKEKDLEGNVVHQGIAVYGNKGSTDQHAYVQQLREGVPNFFVTFIEVREGPGRRCDVARGRARRHLGRLPPGLPPRHAEGAPRERARLDHDHHSDVSPRSVGMLIALYERAVGLYASLVGINAYHQPGVEAGKKAAAAVLALQGKIIVELRAKKGGSRTAEELAKAIGAEEETETVFKVLEHLAANPDHGVTKKPGGDFSRVHSAGEGGPPTSWRARALLLLVGGGHAHLEVVRRLILEPRKDIELVLVSDASFQHYSGMVPGFLRGAYTEDEIAVDLARLVAKAAGVFVKGRAVGVDPKAGVVRLEDSRELVYDLVSFNIGSLARWANTEDVSRNALSIKPIARAVDLRENLRELALTSKAPIVRVAVVGAGAAGVEVACAAAAVLDEARHSRDITIVDGARSILGGYSDSFRAKTKRALEKKHIHLRLGSAVTRIEAGWVTLQDGTRILSELTIWMTGPEAPDIFRLSGLRTDGRGFLLVDSALRSIDDDRSSERATAFLSRRFPGRRRPASTRCARAPSSGRASARRSPAHPVCFTSRSATSFRSSTRGTARPFSGGAPLCLVEPRGSHSEETHRQEVRAAVPEPQLKFFSPGQISASGILSPRQIQTLRWFSYGMT